MFFFQAESQPRVGVTFLNTDIRSYTAVESDSKLNTVYSNSSNRLSFTKISKSGFILSIDLFLFG